MTEKNILTKVYDLLNLGIQHHQNGALNQAEILYRDALTLQPDNVDVLASLGTLLLNNGNVDEAITFLGKTTSLKPDHVSAQHNLGIALRQKNRLPESIQAFTNAVNKQPNHIGALNNLGSTLYAIGNYKDATTAFHQAIKIQPDSFNAWLHIGLSYYFLNQYSDAEKSFHQAIVLKQDSALAYNGLGITLMETARIDEAIEAFQSAIKHQENFTTAYYNLGNALCNHEQTTEALNVFTKTLKLNPDQNTTLGTYAGLARIYEQQGNLEQAWVYIEKGLELDINHAALNLAAAKCERRVGKNKEAIQRLEKLLPENPSIDADVQYELGFLHELTGNAERAYQYADKANVLLMRQWTPREIESEIFNTRINKLVNIFNKESVDQWSEQKPEPEYHLVFLLGFPRSGTTLLDQILDGHPGIDVLEEKPTLFAMEQQIKHFTGSYPENINSLTDEQITVLRQTYIDTVSKYVTLEDGKIIIDKFPLNTILTGLIWRIFPEAKYILAIRHPCDVCLSCFRQNFGLNAAMSQFLSLKSTVSLYEKVMHAWQHYEKTLPITYHRIRYEDLVEDIEKEAKAIIHFLELIWDPVVLDYTKHARSRKNINTPSYTQVVKPIYKHARNRWRRYTEQIDPYINQLQPFITAFDYDNDEE